MTGYIIQPWDFVSVQAVETTDYNLPLECYPGETGSVEFSGNAKRDYNGYLFRLEGVDTYWKITEAETGDAQSTKLTVSDQTAMFDGAIVQVAYPSSQSSATVTSTMLGFLLGNENAAMQSGDWDKQFSRYLYPYIRGTHAYTGLIPILNSAALVSNDYILYSTTSGSNKLSVTDVYKLVTDVCAAGAKLECSFIERTGMAPGTFALQIGLKATRQQTAIPVYFNDGHTFLLSESYDGDVCSCYVGIWSGIGVFPVVVGRTVFYLNDSNQAVQTKADQINGYTKIEQCSTEAKVLENAQKAFGENQWKHKVEFASDKEYHLNQPVRLMLERGVLNTAISKVVIQSGDDRYHYTCGELPQTAAQHIRANSWSYGQRLPHNPYTGQLAFI